MQDGAPKVHDYVDNNISVQYHWNFGDVEKAFNDSYIACEDKFRTARATHGYIEPPANIAYYDPTGYINRLGLKTKPLFQLLASGSML